jgi:hypothetical protein
LIIFFENKPTHYEPSNPQSSILNFRIKISALKVLVILIILYGTIPSDMAQAQTDSLNQYISVDSGIVNMDTTLRTEHNIEVENATGRTTFFAGGEGDASEGRVGVGTAQPSDKFTVYDLQRASLSIVTNQDSTAPNGLRIAVASNNDQYRNGSQPGDIIIGNADLMNSSSGGSSPLHNDRDCTLPAITYWGYQHQFQVQECVNGPTGPVSSASPPLVVLDIKYNSVTANSNIIANKDLGVMGQAHFFGPVIFNDSISISSANNAPFVIKDNTGYEIFKVNPILKTIYARDLFITMSNFPDYVFNSEYKLMSLYELDTYIHLNKHLPKMPTATTVASIGLNLNIQNQLLTEKVEELTLYMIDLQKQLDSLKKNK